MLQGVEADTVVDDLEPRGVAVVTAVDGERQPGLGGPGVLDDVLQAFLGDPVQRQLDVVGQAHVGEVGADVDLRDGPRQAGQPAGEPQVVQHRGPQPTDRGAGLLQRELGELAGAVQLFGQRRPVVDRLGCLRGGVQPVAERDKPLGDAVVDVPGQPPALQFLSLDDLLDEVLVGALTGDQLPVQPRLVHSAGDEPADDEQQLDVSVTELALRHGVHVEHPHQPAGVGLHRHRHHRREIPAAQRLERQVPRIGLLVVEDHHRLPVAGHPARDALAQRQPDLADLGVERRGGPGQRQRPLGVVEDVHETHIAVGGGGDDPRGRGGQRLHPGSAGGGLDQLAQQRQFAVGRQQGTRGHW